MLRWLMAVGWMLAVGLCVGQTINSDITFTHITTEQGLASNHVNAAIQDGEGYLWIATSNGLNRYDGYEFREYRHDPTDSLTIPNNEIFLVFLDREGDLWVVARNSGLSRYNRKFDRFERFLPSLSIHSIVEVGPGQLWLLGESVAGIFDKKTGVFNNFTDNYKSTLFMEGAVGQNPDELWLASAFDGLFLVHAKTGALIKQYQHVPGSPGLSSNRLFTVHAGKNHLWVGTNDAGLDAMDFRTGLFTHYRHNPQDPATLRVSAVTSVLEWDQTLWIGTQNGGLSRLSLINQSLTTFLPDPQNPNSLNSSSISHATGLYRDQADRLLISTHFGGVNIIDPQRQVFQNLDADGFTVNAILNDRQGRIWMATENGVIQFDQGQRKKYLNYPVLCLEQDSRGRIWAGSYQNGLLQFNEAADAFRAFTHQPSNPSSISVNEIWSLEQSIDGQQLIIGTRHGISLMALDTPGKFVNLLGNKCPQTGAPIFYFWQALQTDANTVWFATVNGLIRFNLNTRVCQCIQTNPADVTSISSNQTTVLFLDHKKKLWIGTKEGLNRMNGDGTFTRWGRKSGFTSEAIAGIAEDSSGQLWVSTNKGLSQLEPETGRVRNYGQLDGLKSKEFRAAAVYQTPDVIYFGHASGATRFSPSNIKLLKETPCQVFITDLKIFNNSVQVGQFDSLLRQNIRYTRKIALNYDQSVMSIEFAGIHYAHPEKLQYAYQLEGVDRDWIEAGSRRSVTFSHLPAATYTFRVRASIGNNPSGAFETSLEIEVRPPWWQTWWARGGLAAVLVLSFFGLVRYRTRQAENRRIELEELVKSRTLALQASTAKYENLVSNIPIGVYTVKKTATNEYIFTYASQTFCEINGVTEDELKQDFFAGLRNFHPDDLPAFLAANQRSAETDQPFVWEGRLVVNGKTKYVHAESSPRLYPDGSTEWNGIQYEITDRKLAEISLARSEAKYHTLYDSIADAVLITDLKGRMLDVNETARSMFAIPNLQPLGAYTLLDFSATIQESTLSREASLASHWAALMNQGKTSFSWICKSIESGREFPAEINAANLLLEGDMVVQCLVRDISERKAIEAQLQRVHLQRQLILDNIPANVFCKDRNGKFLFVNRQMAEFYGRTPAQLIGLSPDDFDSNSEQTARYRQEDLTVLDSNRPLYIPKEAFTSPDGTPRFFQTIKVPFYIEGEPQSVVLGISVDITARVQVETDLARVSRLLEQTNSLARVGGWEYNLRTQKIFWTNVMYDIHELPLDQAPLVKQATDFILPGPDLESVQEAVRVLVTERKEFDLELRIKTAKGNIRWVRAFGQGEWDEAGCIRIFGAFQDIDPMKQAEVALREARLQAELASAAKSEFLANMSHEIRTPLNGVIGFTDLISKTPLSETQQQYVATVSQSAHALLDIINNILDFSKIEAGKLELAVERVDLLHVLQQVVDIVKYQAHKKSIELLLHVPVTVPRFVYLDEVRLRQILVNLLSNAVKFTDEGEIELKVTLAEVDPVRGCRITFSVRDTGIGIKLANQHKIFEEFAQEDGSTTKRFGGTGLGLTISNRLLALMGSRLQLRSVPGQGSIFWFDVWLESEASTPHTNFPYAGKRVLIVDDHPASRQIVWEVLMQAGIQPQEANSGQAALDQVSAAAPLDALIIDYHMPGMDGITTIQKIRTLPGLAHLPVILLYSAADNEFIDDLCDQLGIRFRLMKPALYQPVYTLLAQAWQEVATHPTSPKTATAQPVSGKTYRVLVAEDNAVNLLLVKSILEAAFPQAEVFEAVNGKEAFLQFQRVNPDIVFMDVRMPEVNGFEATLAIREWEAGRSRVPIIALTAGTSVGDREKSIQSGMDDYLSKPIVQDVFVAMLHKWLGGADPNERRDFSGPAFDFAELKTRLGFPEPALRKIVVAARHAVEELLMEIHQCAKRGDVDGWQAAAHQLKGVALNAAFTRMVQMAKELEELELPQDSLYLIDNRLQALEQSLKELSADITRAFGS